MKIVSTVLAVLAWSGISQAASENNPYNQYIQSLRAEHVYEDENVTLFVLDNRDAVYIFRVEGVTARKNAKLSEYIPRVFVHNAYHGIYNLSCTEGDYDMPDDGNQYVVYDCALKPNEFYKHHKK